MIRISPDVGAFLRQVRGNLPLDSEEMKGVEILLTGSLNSLSIKDRQNLATLCEKDAIRDLAIPARFRDEFKVIASGVRAFRTPQEKAASKRRVRQTEG